MPLPVLPAILDVRVRIIGRITAALPVKIAGVFCKDGHGEEESAEEEREELHGTGQCWLEVLVGNGW
jgi:hypothetical protein